jgi:predicted RND superfamily exporter protein
VLAAQLASELEAAGLEAEAFRPFMLALTAPRELSSAELPGALKPLIKRHLARDAGASVIATVVHPRPKASAADQRRLASALRRSVAGLDPFVAVEVTGAAVAGDQMADLLRRDLLLVSLLSLALVLVVLTLLLRRLRAVAAAALSLLLTGLAFIGALRALDLQVDLYSLMVLPLLIGYGVDDHIYVVRRALTDGVRTAVVESGRAVVATTLTSMAAFGALALCQVPGLRTLGLTAILGLALGLFGSLVVMPALLSLGREAP